MFFGFLIGVDIFRKKGKNEFARVVDMGKFNETKA